MPTKSELKELEKILNEDWYMEQEGYTFKILNDTAKDEAEETIDAIVMQVFADDKLLYTYSTTKIFDTLEGNIKSLIGCIYAEAINFRKHFIITIKEHFYQGK